MKNKKIVVMIFCLFFALIFAKAVLSSYLDSELESKAKDLIQYYSNNESEDVVSVTAMELIIEKNGVETKIKLPKDEFFVSIAPYYEKTHECVTHFLTKCLGELKNEVFLVEIKNEKGEMIVSEEITSTARGWIDLWLPRDQTFDVTLTHNGTTKTMAITTFSTSKTCVSDFLLK